MRQYFDPKVYRIILFDQRGSGKSTPYAELKENTTWDLVEDIQKIKNHLGIEKWVVFGGSWGSTLALAYAQTYPESCKALVLRGIFGIREKELQWFYQEGASYIYPDFWEEYLKPIPVEERGDLIQAYYKKLTSEDKQTRLEAAKAWSIWEAATSKLFVSDNLISNFGSDEFAEAFARIECHYFVNKGFMEEGQLIKNVDKIKHIPAVIVQGRYDLVCPMYTAWDLHKAWPEASFEIIQDAGHSSTEPGTIDKLVEYTNKFSVL